MNPRHSEIEAVVLAGGMGTRIRHLLPNVPKPMALVAGRPFIEHVLRYIAGFGVHRVTLSTGYRSEVIEAHFATERLRNLQVACVREASPLGTAGGFLQAIKGREDSVDFWLVLNGDSLVFADLGDFFCAFDAGNWDAGVMGLRVADAGRFGTLAVGDNDDLRGFAEKRPGAGLINAGVYLFRPAVLSQFPTNSPLSFETDVFPALVRLGMRVLVHPVEAPFLDIGTPESLKLADDFIRANRSRLGAGE